MATKINYVYGVGSPLTPVFPPPVQAQRAPASTDINFPAGQVWYDDTQSPPVGYQFNGYTWDQLNGGSESLTSLTVTGATTLTGTTNINTTGSAVTTIGTGGTGAVAIGNATGGTTVTGSLNVTGNLNLTSVATQIQMNGGAATDFIGTSTLVLGTVTIANTNIATGDRIFLSRTAANASTTLGELSYTISAGASFTVTSLILGTPASPQTADVSSFAYFIVRQT